MLSSDELKAKVEAWLETEGFPLEFRTANLMRKYGFWALQGSYVEDAKQGSLREIDVAASVAVETNYGLLRVENIIECKWSRDKPWVVFTSPTTTMATSACIAQTMASQLSEAILWAMAGNETLQALGLFATSAEGGFAGRQAFAKGNDHFYDSLQGVVSNCAAYILQADRGFPTTANRASLLYGVIAVPVVVVDGELFSASFDVEADKIVVAPVNQVRCHWNGSPFGGPYNTVDIVSINSFDGFAKQRSADCETLLNIMVPTLDEIAKCIEFGSLEHLTITQGPRGVTGTPLLLRRIGKGKKDSP